MSSWTGLRALWSEKHVLFSLLSLLPFVILWCPLWYCDVICNIAMSLVTLCPCVCHSDVICDIVMPFVTLWCHLWHCDLICEIVMSSVTLWCHLWHCDVICDTVMSSVTLWWAEAVCVTGSFVPSVSLSHAHYNIRMLPTGRWYLQFLQGMPHSMHTAMPTCFRQANSTCSFSMVHHTACTLQCLHTSGRQTVPAVSPWYATQPRPSLVGTRHSASDTWACSCPLPWCISCACHTIAQSY